MKNYPMNYKLQLPNELKILVEEYLKLIYPGEEFKYSLAKTCIDYINHGSYYEIPYPDYILSSVFFTKWRRDVCLLESMDIHIFHSMYSITLLDLI